MRNLRALPDYSTSLYRVVVGFLMACHGASSLFAFPVKAIGGHQEKALLPMADGGEPAALFSWAFPSIAVLGAGPLSLDAAPAKVRRGTGAGAAGSDGESAPAIA